MKTLNLTRVIVIALFVGFVSTFSTYAESPAAISAKNIRQKFVQAVQNPKDMSTMPTSGEVEVLFSINDDGIVEIQKLKGSNDEVTNYVKEKITNVSCKDFVHPYDQYYKVKFRFQEQD
jgi:uncharacterized protein (UPF0333 family)